MTANQPGLIDEGGRERVSDEFFELMVECADNHEEGCSCRYSGVVSPRQVIIEDHDGYVVVADLA